MIWELRLKACNMFFYATFDIFPPPITGQYIQVPSHAKSWLLISEQKELQALLVDWALQRSPTSRTPSAILWLHLYSFTRKENSSDTWTEGWPLFWNGHFFLHVTKLFKTVIVPHGFAWVLICRRAPHAVLMHEQHCSVMESETSACDSLFTHSSWRISFTGILIEAVFHTSNTSERRDPATVFKVNNAGLWDYSSWFFFL